MVRLKHRYLLVHILYPEDAASSSSVASISSSKNNHLHLPPAFHIYQPTPDYLTPGLLAKVVKDAVGELFGDFGVGCLGGGVGVKYLSPATSTAILRCPRNSYRLVWAALTSLSRLPPSSSSSSSSAGKGCVFRVVRVSGTMRKAEEEAIRRARMVVRRVLAGEGDIGGGDGLVDFEGNGDVAADVDMEVDASDSEEEDDQEEDD